MFYEESIKLSLQRRQSMQGLIVSDGIITYAMRSLTESMNAVELFDLDVRFRHHLHDQPKDDEDVKCLHCGD